MPTCKECRYWKPDIFIEYLGECDKKRGATNATDAKCEEYALKTDSDFMWCCECRTTVHKSEKPAHKGHSLHASTHTDVDAHEYISAGD